MKKIALLTIGLALWTTACGDDAVAPEAQDLSEDEAAELAAGMAEFGGVLIGSSMEAPSSYDAGAISAAVVPSAEPSADSVDFSIPLVTRSCPLGGTVELSGSLQGEYDSAAGTVSASFTGSHDNIDCAYAVKGDTAVTNGSGEIEATVERVDNEWAGEQTRTYQGEFDWTLGEDRSGHCSIDFTVVLDPGEQTRTVTGTACGHSIERTTTFGTA